MRNYILFLGLFILISCKSTEKLDNKTEKVKLTKGSIHGIVSHKLQNEGCKTLIIVVRENQDKPMILIPIEGLEQKFDKDNQKISFDYLPLKVKNPEGCNIGIPVSISNVSAE